MLGKFMPYGNTPFFWTRHYNKSLQFVGHSSNYDEVFIQGNPLENKFLAYYIKNNKVIAVAG
jgi:hypothetical protein